MKKINRLLSSIAISTCVIPTTLIATTASLTSCSQKTLLEQLESAMIQEFKDICKIPHSSDKFLYEVPFKSNVLALSNYLQKRCEALTGQHVWQDKFCNLWFDVPANDETLEGAPVIALQAHMDMVFSFDPTKYTPESYPDPLTTSIDVVEDTVNGKRVLHSRDYKTSIGADNGMGVAQILAIIGNKNVKHGPLRVIITNCEENAMQGAKMIVEGKGVVEGEANPIYPTNPQILDDCNYVLNIDGEEEGEIVIACSGGVGSHYTKEGGLVETSTLSSLTNKLKVKISGFNGGHSGGVINKKGANALKIVAETLAKLGDNNYAIANIETTGTTVYNKIPTECTVEILTNKTATDVDNAFKAVQAAHTQAGGATEWQIFTDLPTAKCDVTTDDFTKVIPLADSSEIIGLINKLTYGVVTWTAEGATEENKTSANVGPASVTISGDKYTCKLSSYSRSDKETEVTNFYNSNMADAQTYKFSYLCDAKFPGFDTASDKMDLANMTKAGWKEAGVAESSIVTSKIHGGVECSWWIKAMKDIGGRQGAQTVSYGPKIADCHQATETAYLDTIQACLKTTMYILNHANELPPFNK